MVWYQVPFTQQLQLFVQLFKLSKLVRMLNALQAPSSWFVVLNVTCLETVRLTSIQMLKAWLRLPSTLLSQPRCLASIQKLPC